MAAEQREFLWSYIMPPRELCRGKQALRLQGAAEVHIEATAAAADSVYITCLLFCNEGEGYL